MILESMLENNKGINVIPIGSGSTGNSIYIEIDKYQLLVDMGMGYKKIKAALEKNNRNIEDIDAVFITHGHNDHVKSCKAISNHLNCNIYAHKSSFYNLRDSILEKKELAVNENIEVLDKLIVRMFPVPHDFAYTFGFTFTFNNKKVAYLTDCGLMNDNILKELCNSNLVVIESNHDIDMLENGHYPKELQKRIKSKHGHLSNDDCADAIDFLYKHDCKSFLLAHISKQNNTPELALNCVNEKMKDKDIFVYACLESSDDFLEF